MLEIPEYAIDCTHEVILARDSAWDHKRIDKERKKLTKGERHPVDHYLRGATRYDTQAPLTVPEALRKKVRGTKKAGPDVCKVSDYLTGRPTRFVIRPLDFRQTARAYDLTKIEGQLSSFAYAVEHGLVDIEDSNLVVDKLPDGSLTDELLNRLNRAPGLLTVLGAAVLNISQDLDVAAKKP